MVKLLYLPKYNMNPVSTSSSAGYIYTKYA